MTTHTLPLHTTDSQNEDTKSSSWFSFETSLYCFITVAIAAYTCACVIAAPIMHLTVSDCYRQYTVEHMKDMSFKQDKERMIDIVDMVDCLYYNKPVVLLGLNVLEGTFVRHIIFAAIFGALIGWERQQSTRDAGAFKGVAGVRTMLLICVGSCVFTLCSIWGFSDGPPILQFTGGGMVKNKWDTSRVAAQIVSGVGFLGGGVLIKDGATVKGLTTAASIWAAAAVGMCVAADNTVIGFMLTCIIMWVARTNRGFSFRSMAATAASKVATQRG